MKNKRIIILLIILLLLIAVFPYLFIKGMEQRNISYILIDNILKGIVI